jgi:hypothetical protein
VIFFSSRRAALFDRQRRMRRYTATVHSDRSPGNTASPSLKSILPQLTGPGTAGDFRVWRSTCAAICTVLRIERRSIGGDLADISTDRSECSADLCDISTDRSECNADLCDITADQGVCSADLCDIGADRRESRVDPRDISADRHDNNADRNSSNADLA